MSSEWLVEIGSGMCLSSYHVRVLLTAAHVPHLCSDRTVGPAVRTLLELYDIDASNVTATGRHGLLKSDVLAYISQHKLTPQPPTPGERPVDPSAVRGWLAGSGVLGEGLVGYIEGWLGDRLAAWL